MKLIRNRLFLATICVILSALCVYSFLQANTTEDLTAYKLNCDVTKGTEITSEMLTTVTIGSKGMEDVISDEKEIVGMYSNTDLLNGQMLFGNIISKTESEVLQGLEKLDGKKIAYAITIKGMASSVAGKVQLGDVVSVFINTNGQSILPPELKYVEVLHATTDSGAEKTETTEESISTITLLVDENQARLLNEYEYTSSLHLALVHRGDDDMKAEYLSQKHLIDEDANQEDGASLENNLEDVPQPVAPPTENPQENN